MTFTKCSHTLARGDAKDTNKTTAYAESGITSIYFRDEKRSINFVIGELNIHECNMKDVSVRCVFTETNVM